MSAPVESEKPTQEPWHRGYLDPKTLVAGMAASIATAVLLGVLNPVSSKFGRIVINNLSLISQRSVDAAYARAVVQLEYTISMSWWSIYTIIMAGTLGVYVFLMWMMFFNENKFLRLLINKNGKMNFAFPLMLTIFTASVVSYFAIQLSLFDLTYRVMVTEGRRMVIFQSIASESERREAFVRWGNLQTKADFDAMMQYMQGVASKYNCKFPKRLDD